MSMTANHFNLQNISVRFTEPHSSDQLLTVHIGDQVATLSNEDTNKLYLWLHQHRQAFMSFYGEGWKLAGKYWQTAGAPDNYSAMLELFNAHCHEIHVAPFHDSDKGSSELAINGFIASIHAMMVWEEGVDLVVEQHHRLEARHVGLRREGEDEEESE